MTSSADPARRSGRLFVISGPSGVGKDSVIDGLKKLGRPYHFTVTATTRTIRPGETNGIDYIFLSREEFRHMIEQNDLLEWAEVYGNLYGVPKSQVTDALNRGQDVIMKIDVQGAATVRKLHPDALLIFLEPPDMKSLEERMRIRNTESETDFQTKLKTAFREMNEASWFDHRVINRDGHLDDAIAAIDRIINPGQQVKPPHRIASRLGSPGVKKASRRL